MIVAFVYGLWRLRHCSENDSNDTTMSVLRSTVKSPVSTHFTAKRRVGRAVLCLAISAAAVGLTRFFRKRHNSERVEKSKADDCGESDTCQKIESLAGGRVNAIKITGAPLRLSEHIKLVESDVCGVRYVSGYTLLSVYTDSHVTL